MGDGVWGQVASEMDRGARVGWAAVDQIKENKYKKVGVEFLVNLLI